MNNQQTEYKYRIAEGWEKKGDGWCKDCQKSMSDMYYQEEPDLFNFILENDLENVVVYECNCCGKYEIVAYEDDW